MATDNTSKSTRHHGAATSDTDGKTARLFRLTDLLARVSPARKPELARRLINIHSAEKIEASTLGG